MKTAPLLSIGMIFKNEARCIERCLQSLQPLREAIPCELVMADTGADDGSREIAERYADEVFDFPWIDDFAAARNAVMDRCHGKWYFSIDCDEWLDEDITELTAFLQSGKKADFGFVTVRNYKFFEPGREDIFSDFFALRLVRMATGERYHGAIHESWVYREPFVRLLRTLLHHDGYMFSDPEQQKKKFLRNMKLLRRELERDPENLRTLVHCIDSSRDTPDHLQFIRQAVDVVQAKGDGWEQCGGAVLRSAVKAAQEYELPELEEWIGFSYKDFPESIHVQVDLNHAAFVAAHDANQWEQAIRYGEAYRKGLRAANAVYLSQKAQAELAVSGLQFAHPDAERLLLIGLADAYAQARQGAQAIRILSELDGAKLDAKQVRNYVVALCWLHAQCPEDTAPVLTAFYEQISAETPNQAGRNARLAAFHAIAAASFTAAYRSKEQQEEGYHRPAYTAFAALAEKCEAGRGAAVMMAIEPAEMREWLVKVEDWQALPIEALEYALREGVPFPLPEKPLPVEVLDGLAARLTHGENTARRLTLALPEDAAFESLQALFWAQALAMAALRSFDWTLGESSRPASKFACPEKKPNESEAPACTAEEGLALLRRFAALEAAALPLLYTPQALAEENAALLPPMHRWGLFCAQAFAALDAGSPQEYLALLRRGLAACPGQKVIVQFLLDRFREDARPKASPELLALAERVRTILAAYGPNDPAVAALRESEAYKQVAWLLEDVPGLPVQ